MKRTITVISNKIQGTKVFDSEATTLGELKADLRREGISYDGMDFLEGVSRTTLLDDMTALPSQIMYKGEPTDNLVIMLSTQNKKIKSGALSSERADVIEEAKQIIANNPEAKAEFGNVTQKKTDFLKELIAKYSKKGNKKGAVEVAPSVPSVDTKAIKSTPKSQPKSDTSVSKKESKIAEGGEVYVPYSVFQKLVDYLVAEDYVESDFAEELTLNAKSESITKAEEAKSPFSAADLQSMKNML